MTIKRQLAEWSQHLSCVSEKEPAVKANAEYFSANWRTIDASFGFKGPELGADAKQSRRLFADFAYFLLMNDDG